MYIFFIFCFKTITTCCLFSAVTITNSTLPGDIRISEHISTETSTQKDSQIDTSTMAVTFTTASPRTVTSTGEALATTTQTVSTETSTQKDSQIDTFSATIAVTFTTASPRTGTWFIVLVSIGVAVFLSGLTGLICLCWFAS
ncbi:hypothetical protein cypCar_00033169, partial [Cyprinus carpio]